MPRRGPLLLLLLLIADLSAYSAEEKDRLVRVTEARTPEDERQGFHLPEGFSIQLFADETQLGGKPINMAFDARGRLWVSSTREYPYAVPKTRWTDPQGTRAKDSRDTIRILEDTDGDGHADKVTIFADELNIPTGVLPYKNGCIAWSIPNIWYLEDTDNDGKCDKRSILFGPLGYERDTHGMISSLRLGLDGWVYATHGFSNTSHFEVLPQNRKEAPNQSEILDITSGSVFRFKPDGSRVELWTSGQVNPFGLCWDSWGNLYSADCHSNPITQLIRGATYPQFGKITDPLGFGPVMCSHAHGSTGLCGIIYLDGDVWGPEWNDHMFVGNCVTSRVNHDRITFTGSTPKANEAPDFLTSDDPWFRPVDLQLGPDSALYVADFYNRVIGHYEVPLDHPGRDKERARIWRVVREGFTGKLTDCDVTRMSDAQLRQACSGVLRNIPCYVQTLEVGRDRGMNIDVTTLRVETPRVNEQLARQHLTDSYDAPWPAGEFAYSNIHNLLSTLRDDARNDTARMHQVKITLRRVLEHPESFRELQGWSNEAIDDVLLPDLLHVVCAVNSVESANWLLTRHPLVARSGPLVVPVLTHIARHLPADREGELISLAQQHFGDDLDTQLDLLTAIREGRSLALQSRDASQAPLTSAPPSDSISGTQATDPLATWSAELTNRLLASLQSDPPDTWHAVTPPTDTKPNPWRPQVRKCADGKERAFFDSHPPGGEKLTGTLRSAPFALPSKLTFWIAGHRGFPTAPPHELTFVRLVDAATGEELARAYPPRHDTAQEVTWTFDQAENGAERSETDSRRQPEGRERRPESTRAHRQTFIELTDNDTGTAYAWLAAGGFDPAVVTIPTDPLQRDKRIRHLAELCTPASPKDLKVAANPSTAGRSAVSAPAVAFLSSLPQKASFTPETRFALARFLAATSSDPSMPLLVTLSRDEELARTAFALLQPPKSVADSLIGAFRTLPFRSQAKLATALAGSVKSANRLLAIAPPAVLAEPLVSSKLNALDDGKISQRLKTLTASLPPQNEALNKLITQRLKAFNPANADTTRGELVFTTLCSICHRIGVRGNLVGPQLDGIGVRGIERLLEDILDPNRAVDPAFRLHIVKRSDGSLFAGLLRREEGGKIIFADATAQETPIPKSDIAANDESPFSLMPPGLGEALTEQQLHDLLAYLLARK